MARHPQPPNLHATPERRSTAPRPSIVTLPDLAPPPSILDFFDHRFPRVGRETWRQRIVRGKVLGEDGAPIGLGTSYVAGTRLLYFREVEREPAVPRGERIVFESREILVADKPHFLPVTPAGPYVNECLLYRLLRRTGLRDLAPVHRLDRETAGLVLLSADPATRSLYGGLFARGAVVREYLAVARVPREPEGRRWRVATRLERGEPWFRMQVVPGPANAVTGIELLAWRDGFGLFRLLPETGKKHQLRLHLAGLGFPVLGDRSYPELLPEAPPDLSRPLQLLARRLTFRDPVSGEAVDVQSGRRLAWPPAATAGAGGAG